MYLNLNCRPMRAQTASSAALVDNRPEPALAISLHARRAGFSSRSTPAIGPIVQHNAMQECGRPARPLVEAAVPGRSPPAMACFPRGNTRRPPTLVQCTGRLFVPGLARREGNPGVCLLFHAGDFDPYKAYLHSTYKRKARMRREPVYLPDVS
jgi:hypothetical protein